MEIFIGITILILCIFYILFIIVEKVLISYYRKRIPLIVHVNGIRGKSTTTRLIDAGFRECGYKVFSKTTGTVPTVINTNNEEVVIKRLGNANIREQVKMLRRAYKEHADVLVLECMAVNPELQKICEEKILNANITVITNVRMDHVKDMGSSLEDIAMAFTNTIPTQGNLVVTDSPYLPIFEAASKLKDTKVNIALPYEKEELYGTFKENIELALEVCRVAGLDEDKFLEGLKHYHRDVGAYVEIKKDGVIFLNGLSINDPTSILIVYDEVLKKYDKNDITILLNSRSDRPTRVEQHLEMLEKFDCKKIVLLGSAQAYLEKRLKEKLKDVEVVRINKFDDLKNEKVIFAIGNIGNGGMDLLNYFKDGGEIIC